jgi:HAMP domain-containing protein
VRHLFTGIVIAILYFGTAVWFLTLEAPVLAGILFLAGVLVLAAAWHSRSLVPMDPQFQADIEQWLTIHSPDEAHADEMWHHIMAEAGKREQDRLVQLRSRATFDRHAALELRNRLREKVCVGKKFRRWAQRALGGTPDGAVVLQALDREASILRQRWLEAEQFL